MENLKKLGITVLIVSVFLAGYAAGGQIGLYQLHASVTDAIRSSVDADAAREFLIQLTKSESIGKITEIATAVARKLVEWICNFTLDVL